MLISFVGTDFSFFENAFLENATGDNLVDVSLTSTRIIGDNTLTGYRTIIGGTGFVLDSDGFLSSGTITSMTFLQNSVTQATVTGLSWTISDFESVLLADDDTDTEALLQVLGITDITLNASTAGAAADLGSLGIVPGAELVELTIPLTFIGSAFNDAFLGAAGNDTIDGRAGQDTFFVGDLRANATISAITGGVQIITPNGGTDQVLNTETFDFLGTKIAAADIFDIPGQLIIGDDNPDTYVSSTGDDTVRAGRGDDVVRAGGGDDEVNGDGGNDTLEGDAGNDTLRGGRGQDSVEGGGGRDVIRGQREGDTLEGGAGNDNVKGGGGNDLIRGDAGNDFLTGGTRRDTIEGGDGNDRIIGNSFDDSLDGGAGNDNLNAGGQNDTLIGGTGNDTMKGGPGSDTFIFDTGHDMDIIRDLNLDDDILQISAALAGGQDAQAIEDAATLQGTDVIVDFGNGDVITLQGLGTTDGLAEVISIV